MISTSLNIKRSLNATFIAAGVMVLSSCNTEPMIEVFETSAQGHKLERLTDFLSQEDAVSIRLNPEEKFQTITGFGGSFTESTAFLLDSLSPTSRERILQAYFGEDGARYSLTRTHINSCDFSLSNYSYAPVADDVKLEYFSLVEDMDDLIPLIKEAMAISKDGFKIIASPWTAPPWMKDNKDWRGGHLLPQYYDTWALFFSKYLEAYQQEGIDIAMLTVENEPLGNNNNWESMHFSPEEMVDFVKHHMGPQLEADGFGDVKILAYDQNRDNHIYHWADEVYRNEVNAEYFDDFAVHWYASTYDWFPEALDYVHQKAPQKHIIQTEACVDGQVPAWQDDKWYWSKEAMDWGWNWAPEDQKHLHPKYVPVYRYARDIIGCLNAHVDGWVDWNMVLDRQGGPNWFKNWCTAPVIVDTEADEVYFTPLYYVMTHFSRYIRPGAVRIGFENPDDDLMVTAAQNPDGSIAVVILNMQKMKINISLSLNGNEFPIGINAEALQTIIISA